MSTVSKKIRMVIAFVLVVAMLLCINGKVYALPSSKTDHKGISNPLGLGENGITLEFNGAFSERIGNASINVKDWSNSVLSIVSSIKKNGSSYSIELNNGKMLFKDNAVGGMIHMKNDSSYFISLSGVFKSCEGSDDTYYDVESCYSIDLVSVKEDVFAVVSIGAAYKNICPKILFYGNYTDNIAKFYKDYLDELSVIECEQEINTTDAIKEGNLRYDASLQSADPYTIQASGYDLGYLTVYYQAEVERGGNGIIIGKVNSDNTNAASYVQNVLLSAWYEYVSWAIIDTMDIKLSTSTSPDFISVSSHVPLESNSTINLSGFSIGPVSFPNVVISSSTVTQSTDQIRRWTLYKSGGWSDIELLSNGSSGVWTRMYTHVNTGSSGNIDYVAELNGRVKYLYAYVNELDNGTYVGSFWAGSISAGPFDYYTVVDN